MRVIFFVFLIFITNSSFADLALDKSRVILHDDSGTGVFKVKNTGLTPVLVQSWASGYADSNDTESEDAAVIPPVSRLMPGEIKSFRVISFMKLRNKEEKLLLINLQQVPVLAGDMGTNALSISLRMRFKLLIRGRELVSSGMHKRVELLHCMPTEQKFAIAINCINDSNYHFIVSGIRDAVSGKFLNVEGETIAPSSSKIFSLKQIISSGSALELIDDDGKPFIYTLK